MAEGGPFTAQALGEPPPMVATVGGTPVPQDGGGLQPIGGPATSAQGRPEGNLAGGGMGLGVQAPNYAWQVSSNDLFPGGTRIQSERTAWGDPIMAPSPSVIPWSVIANRQQAISKQRNALNAEVRAWDPYKDMPTVHPAYSESFQKAYMDRTQKRIQEAIAAHGGDYTAAYLDLNNPASQLGQQFKREQLALLTIARKSNDVTDRAANTVDQMRMGKAEFDPLVYEQGQRVLDGSEYSGDAIKLADEFEQFEAVTNFSSFLKENGMMAALTGAKFGQDVVLPARNEKGHIVWETVSGADPAARQRIIDSMYEQVPLFYKEMWGEQGVKDRLGAYLTRDDKRNLDIREQWHGWSPSQQASQQPKAMLGGPEQGKSTQGLEASDRRSAIDYFGKSTQPYVAQADVTRWPMTEVSGGKSVSMGPRRFTDASGNHFEMKPSYIERRADGLYITGKAVGDTQSVTTTEIETDENGDQKEVLKTVDTSKTTGDVAIPVRGNEASLDLYIPGWREQVGGGATGFGGARRVASQADVDALPKGTVFTWTDGKQYTKD